MILDSVLVRVLESMVVHVSMSKLQTWDMKCKKHMFTHLTNLRLSLSLSLLLPSFLFLFVSLTLLLSLCYAGLGCHSLKGTALTSMAFFSCLVRHQTPAWARPLAPWTEGLLWYSGLDHNSLDRGLWICYWLDIHQFNISITKLLVLHLLRTQFERIIHPKIIFTQISPKQKMISWDMFGD